MPPGKDRRYTRARDTFCVRCWVFNRVQEGGLYLIVGGGDGGATPDGVNKCVKLARSTLQLLYITLVEFIIRFEV